MIFNALGITAPLHGFSHFIIHTSFTTERERERKRGAKEAVHIELLAFNRAAPKSTQGIEKYREPEYEKGPLRHRKGKYLGSRTRAQEV